MAHKINGIIAGSVMAVKIKAYRGSSGEAVAILTNIASCILQLNGSQQLRPVMAKRQSGDIAR